MKWSARAFGVVVLLGIAVGLFFLERRFGEHPITFATIEEASARVQAAGLHVTADNPSGNITKGFLVSREPYH
jgi:hypothetical protein